jgi:2-amino-4-hydroxy-6-hydroxymethyldihydropteridine diphosphokinase / dihydropteroate synthase
MKCYIGLGSNRGDRLKNLETAAQLIKNELAGGRGVRVSPVYESDALLPHGAPLDWDQPYLNGVIEFEFSGNPRELLAAIKKIELRMGREASMRWAPRVIDLDLLLFGKDIYEDSELQIPHPEIVKRAFVLDPLKDLSPSLVIPGHTKMVLHQARQLPGHSPLWMGIVNLTPDSFSDGGVANHNDEFTRRLEDWDRSFINYFDLGAESTRPGADVVSPELEWQRLGPRLSEWSERHGQRMFRPRLSVDTRHPETARKAIANGADMINDVSGLIDPGMLEVLSESECDYVLMHSLSVPADRELTLPTDVDPVQVVGRWFSESLERLSVAGVSLDRVVLDPGLGFGKTVEQSYRLACGVDLFLKTLNQRVLVGHSRKSFLNRWGERPASERDLESVGLSLALAFKGVDILRVHEPVLHRRAFRPAQSILTQRASAQL